MKGPDKEKWVEADKKEEHQHRYGDRPTFQHMLGGRADIPRGCKALPLKRVCTIKDTGEYKVRWVVLGNLE